MKITQDVREFANQQNIQDVNAALKKGMQEKAEEFKQQGSEIYHKK
jgi:phosphomethylpyrimidine synthase